MFFSENFILQNRFFVFVLNKFFSTAFIYLYYDFKSVFPQPEVFQAT